MVENELFCPSQSEHWNRLPGEVVESPSVQVFKTQLDAFLCNLL